VQSAVDAKPSLNGATRIPRKGMMTVAFGEEGTPGGQPITFDAIEVSDGWFDVDSQFRDDSKNVPKDRYADWKQGQKQFVQGVIQRHWTGKPEDCPQLTGAEVEEFMDLLNKEVARLRSFFGASTPSPPSSPSSTEVRFSQ